MTGTGRECSRSSLSRPWSHSAPRDPSRCCHDRHHDTRPFHVNHCCLSGPSVATADVSRETDARRCPCMTRAAISMYRRASACSRDFRLSEHCLAGVGSCLGCREHRFHGKRGEWLRGQVVALPTSRRRALDRSGQSGSAPSDSKRGSRETAATSRVATPSFRVISIHKRRRLSRCFKRRAGA